MSEPLTRPIGARRIAQSNLEETAVPARIGPARRSLAIATIGCLLGLAACQSGPVTGELTVIEWYGYETTDWYEDFATAYPEVTVNFDLWNSDAEVYNSLKGGTPADIVHPYTGWLKFYVDEGLVQEIDTSKLENWDKVRDDLKALGQYNGKQYFIPWDWGFSSVLYRTDKLSEVKLGRADGPGGLRPRLHVG